jgi:hypothetical protein
MIDTTQTNHTMSENNNTPSTVATKALIEIPWTDDSIRWSEDPPKKIQNDENDHDSEIEETGLMDPFKDPDPFRIFSFTFKNPYANNETIDIKLRGYKSEADEIWQSTGLTLWRASEFLCEFQLNHAEMFRGKRILEVSSMY